MSLEQCVQTRMIHGLRVHISCAHCVADAIFGRLACFPVVCDTQRDISFVNHIVPEDALDPIEQPVGLARAVYASALGDVLYYEATDELYITCADEVRVLCDLTQGHIHISIRSQRPDLPWLVSHPLLTLPLMEVLKRRGRFSVHAAGVSRGGKGILFPGTSGAGKSTLSLALARAGFALLGDDLVFLAQGGLGLRSLAFPEDIDITDDTAMMFADLHGVAEVPKEPGWPKRRVPLEGNAQINIAWECQPAVLVFPRVAHAAQSVVTPIDRDEALLELVPNILLTAPEASQAHLDVLAELCNTCSCYRLETGRDLDTLPDLIGALVE